MRYKSQFVLSFTTTFLVLLSWALQGQKLDHVLGEYIVHVERDSDIKNLIKEYSAARSAFEHLTAKKIMTQPMNIWVLSVDPSTVNEILFEKSLRSKSAIKEVRKNHIITPRLLPNDPQLAKQWQYINTGMPTGVENADIDMDMAWDIATGGVTANGDTIVVCVIDDGINAQHEDMKDNVWVNYLEIPNNGIDDDGNGYIDDVRGWNVSDDNDNVYEGGGHGTPVAGIVGAKGNNEVGVSGVNWDVKLMIVDYSSSTEANAIAAYAYPYQMRKLYNQTNGAKGAFVVSTNASWGIDNGKAEDAPLWCALYDSLGHVGILNCGATANANTDVDVDGDLPTSCSSEYLIAVTNLNKSDVKLTNAGYGRKTIDLGSFGHQAYTVTQSGYGSFGGTSGATPHVTGLIALMYSAPCNKLANLAKTHPSQAALVAKDMILHGVVPNTSLSGITTTGGRVNTFRAMQNIMDLCSSCSVPAGLIITPQDAGLGISWLSDSGNAKIGVRYRKADQFVWDTIATIGQNFVIPNLEICTEYEVQISSDCGLIPDTYSYSRFINTTGCCPKPANLTFVADQQSIEIAWETIENSDYLVQYKIFNGAWQDTLLVSPPFKLSGLAPCTGVTYRVQSACNEYQNVSNFTPELDTYTSCGECTDNQYCGFAAKDNRLEWISYVKVGSLENQSNAADRGYQNFAGQATTDLKQGQKYPVEIRAGYLGTEYLDYYKVFIDFNQDGEWDPAEIVLGTKLPVQTRVEGSITIPDDALEGLTRMRIIQNYDVFDEGCDVGTFDYGEVEDYCVTIIKNECTNVATLNFITIDQDNILFTATYPGSTKDTILFGFRAKGTSEWIEVLAQDTIEIAGLLECTEYEYFYRGKCGDVYSSASDVSTLKTACKINVSDPSLALWSIYPNPATDILTLSTPNVLNNIVNIQVVTISGKSIAAQYLKKNVNSWEISLGGLPTGVYMLQVTTQDGETSYRKVVKI